MLHCLSQEISFIICYYRHTSINFHPLEHPLDSALLENAFLETLGHKGCLSLQFSCVLIHSLSSFLWLRWAAVSKPGVSFQTSSMGDEEYKGKERGSNCRKNVPLPNEPVSFEKWELVERARIVRRSIGNYDLPWTALIHGKFNSVTSVSDHPTTQMLPPSPSSPLFCLCV